MAESKHDKFIRVAEARTNKIIDTLSFYCCLPVAVLHVRKNETGPGRNSSTVRKGNTIDDFPAHTHAGKPVLSSSVLLPERFTGTARVAPSALLW